MSAAPQPRAFVVLDLGFGDAGKGLVTDSLVREHRASLVVRFNGGAQAGHNVVTPDGLHHTFAQFGAGTFAGAHTLLSEHVVVHPTALLREAEVLRSKGVTAPLARMGVHAKARSITPFQQAANRLRELARGEARHGSCGVGVGETVSDSLRSPEDVVRAEDLFEPVRLHRKLLRVQERKRAELGAWQSGGPLPSEARQEVQMLEDPEVARTWADAASALARRDVILSDEDFTARLRAAPLCVFEGAQGVLLDEDFGFHPFTTWSHCTARNAHALLARALPGVEACTVGVLRAYAVRHGPGPLPTECHTLRDAIREHNVTNAWQGQVRYGWFDAVLARYAMEVTGQVDELFITHLDVASRLDGWQLCNAYDTHARLEVPTPPDLTAQARLTALLERAVPRWVQVPSEEGAIVECIEAALGRPVNAGSRGPTAKDVVRRRREETDSREISSDGRVLHAGF